MNDPAPATAQALPVRNPWAVGSPLCRAFYDHSRRHNCERRNPVDDQWPLRESERQITLTRSRSTPSCVYLTKAVLFTGCRSAEQTARSTRPELRKSSTP